MFIPDVFNGAVLSPKEIELKFVNAIPANILEKMDLSEYIVVKLSEEWAPVVLNIDPLIPVFKGDDEEFYIVVNKKDKDLINILEVMINGFI